MGIGVVIGLIFGGWLLSSGLANLRNGVASFNRLRFDPMKYYPRSQMPVRFWLVVSAKLAVGGVLLGLVPVFFVLYKDI